MKTDLADSYQRLTEIINPLIERAERALAGLGLNVSSGVALVDGCSLVFIKLDREWRLMRESNNGTLTLLCTASRSCRLEALELLPKLVEALTNEAWDQSTSAKRVIQEATAFVEKLESTRVDSAEPGP